MRKSPHTLAAATMTVTSAIIFGLAPSGVAQAADSPTSLELLQKCNQGTDSCVFHHTSSELFAGQAHQVGTTLFNCGPGDATKTVAWSDSTGESNSVGVSFIIAQEGNILGAFGAFKSEVEISYGHRWGTTQSTTRSGTVKIGAGQKAWLTRETAMQRVSGTYELHFSSRFKGHYIWYVPFSATGPAPDQKDVIVQHEANMTAGEKEQCK